MPRRVALPGAEELFRPTEPVTDAGRRHSGRVKHDAKITVYVSSAELLELEQTRLRLRAELGINVDRGRLVREALDIMLADLAANGADSDIAQRLRQ